MVSNVRQTWPQTIKCRRFTVTIISVQKGNYVALKDGQVSFGQTARKVDRKKCGASVVKFLPVLLVYG